MNLNIVVGLALLFLVSVDIALKIMASRRRVETPRVVAEYTLDKKGKVIQSVAEEHKEALNVIFRPPTPETDPAQPPSDDPASKPPSTEKTTSSKVSSSGSSSSQDVLEGGIEKMGEEVTASALEDLVTARDIVRGIIEPQFDFIVAVSGLSMDAPPLVPTDPNEPWIPGIPPRGTIPDDIWFGLSVLSAVGTALEGFTSVTVARAECATHDVEFEDPAVLARWQAICSGQHLLQAASYAIIMDRRDPVISMQKALVDKVNQIIGALGGVQ